MSASGTNNEPKNWDQILKDKNKLKKEKKIKKVKEENGRFNRIADCVPYEFNAIKVEKDNQIINASKIKFEQVQRNFILTETPMSENVSDFWAMVIQHKCEVIVMLGDFKENTPKSYLPLPIKLTTHNGPQGLRIKKTSEEQLENSLVKVSDLTVIHQLANKKIEAFSIVNYQLHKLKTDEKDLNELENRIDKFVRALEFMRPALAATAGKECSTLIHCPSGCKDSATFLLIDACVTDIVNQKKLETDHRLDDRLYELLLQRDLPPLTGKDLKFANAVITKYVQKVKSANWKEELKEGK